VLLAKGLGGCGTHNAMLYVRAMQADIESWNMTGEGWDWKEVLATYKELESYVPAVENSDVEVNIPSYHGTGVSAFECLLSSIELSLTQCVLCIRDPTLSPHLAR
jgi:choline dehydrogenase-like flavoprotein